MSRSFARLSLFALLAVATLGFTGCVPYVKHQDVVKKLDQANEVNRDLERALQAERLRLSELGGDAGLAQVRYKAAQEQLRGLQDQLDACEESNERLRSQLSNMPAVPMPDQFTSGEAAGMGVERSSSGALIFRELNFASGKSSLREGQRRALAELIRLLKGKYDGRIVHLEGHTDVDPVTSTAATNKDNWFLSCKRAHAVFEYLTKEGGIDASRFRIHGYGASRQAEGNVSRTTAEGKAKDRRVEVRLGN
ncbi:MAG: OmpA family protein [Planctomycetota bacterium]